MIVIDEAAEMTKEMWTYLDTVVKGKVMRKTYLNTKSGLRKGLLAVAEMLETKALVHTDTMPDLGDNPPKPNQLNFNLEVTALTNYNCGTVACIGGWCWLLNKETPDSKAENGTIVYDYSATERAEHFVHRASDQDNNLRDLFYPPFEMFAEEAAKNGSEDWKFWDDMEDYRKVTPEQAAKAIRNYLKDGNSDWRSVMQQKEMGV